jgi:hypothetical protein
MAVKTKSQRQAIDDHAPWLPPPFEDHIALAVRAVTNGTATAQQQRQAMEWIINIACATYDLAYRPGDRDGERNTTFALGRQFVGQQLVKLLKIKIGLLKKEEK